MKAKKILYQCILLKISGEALKGNKKFGIDKKILIRIAKEIKELVKLNIKVAIVIGGGNFFRGEKLENIGITRVVGDHIGMLSTIINGLIICNFLKKNCVDSYLMSSIPLNGICQNYNWDKAIDLLKKKRVVIFSAGIGNPFFTTDLAACLRGIEIGADVIFKATKVDGVFSSDPLKNSNAIFYEKIDYNDILYKKIKIMDSSAFMLARDHNLPICIFNINKPGILKKIIMGYKEGTWITNMSA